MGPWAEMLATLPRAIRDDRPTHKLPIPSASPASRARYVATSAWIGDLALQGLKGAVDGLRFVCWLSDVHNWRSRLVSIGLVALGVAITLILSAAAVRWLYGGEANEVIQFMEPAQCDELPPVLGDEQLPPVLGDEQWLDDAEKAQRLVEELPVVTGTVSYQYGEKV